MPKTKESQLQASKKYLADKVHISFWATRDFKTAVENRAKDKGLSLAAYLTELIEKDMQK